MPPALPNRNSTEPFASTVRVSFAARVTVKRVFPLLNARTQTGALAVNCTRRGASESAPEAAPVEESIR